MAHKIEMVALLVTVLLLVSPVEAKDSDLESWYTLWSVGWSSITYPGEANDDFNEARNLLNNVGVSADLLGFYWPWRNRTILGFVINASSDIYWANGGETAFTIYQPSLSALHFFNNDIGKGPFLRFDIGTAKLVVSSDIIEETSSQWGSGILFGAGVGIPITEGTRALMSANYSGRKIEGDIVKTFSLSMGLLF